MRERLLICCDCGSENYLNKEALAHMRNTNRLVKKLFPKEPIGPIFPECDECGSIQFQDYGWIEVVA